jgi:hypothetical protein
LALEELGGIIGRRRAASKHREACEQKCDSESPKMRKNAVSVDS